MKRTREEVFEAIREARKRGSVFVYEVAVQLAKEYIEQEEGSDG